MEKNKKAYNINILLFSILIPTALLPACSGKGVRDGETIESGTKQLQNGADSHHEGVKSTAPTEKTTGASAKALGTGFTEEASAEYHFNLAQAYVAEGNPDRAIEEFKMTLVYDPKSPLVYTRLASEYIKKGMLSSAMETCKEALQRDPKYTDARLILAGLYSAARSTEQALTEYDFILKQHPDHEEAVVYKAQIQLERTKGAAAVAELRRFLKRNPESALVWFYLGRSEQQLDHFKEAEVAYKKAIKVRPGFSHAALALGYLYEEQKLNKEAIATYRELFEQGQDLTAANRISTLLLKQEKYVEAIPFLESVAAQDPDDLNVRVKLGLVQMELKQLERAEKTFKEILALAPESDRVHYYLGNLYEELNKPDAAAAELIQIKPESKLFTDSALHVAAIFKDAGKIDVAKSYMNETIRKSPNTAAFHIYLAHLNEESMDLAGATRVLEGAVATFPEDEKVRYYLGSLYDKQGKADRGIEQMEAILKINADNVDALNYVGYTWTIQGIRLKDAEKLLKRALALKPDNGYVQDSWGWHLFVTGRIAEAIVQLEKAAKLKPEESTILEHLADAYLGSNLREKALLRYQDAARVAGENGAREKLTEKAETLRRELARGGSQPTLRMPASQPASEPLARD